MIGDTMDIFERFRNDSDRKNGACNGWCWIRWFESFDIDWFNWAQMFVSGRQPRHRASQKHRRSHWRWFGIC